MCVWHFLFKNSVSFQSHFHPDGCNSVDTFCNSMMCIEQIFVLRLYHYGSIRLSSVRLFSYIMYQVIGMETLFFVRLEFVKFLHKTVT